MSTSWIDVNNYTEETPLEQNILNLKKLPGKEATKFAICEYCSMRSDRNGNPFASYKFRDCNGRRISGRTFLKDNPLEVATTLPKMLNRVVQITFTADYFETFYLRIRGVQTVSPEVSEQIKSKFFITTIPNFNQELTFFRKIITQFPEKLLEIYKLFDVEYRLTEGYYYDVMEGMKGSPMKLIVSFSSQITTFRNRSEGIALISSYALIEAILSNVGEDPSKIIQDLATLKNLFGEKIDPTLRLIYDIVESTLYSILGFKRQIIPSSCILIKEIRDFLIRMYTTVDLIENSLGVFQYDNQLYEKRG